MNKMSKKEYCAALDKFGMSIVGAAPVLGISRRQAQRFAAGATVSKPVAKLLKLMVKHDLKPEEVECL